MKPLLSSLAIILLAASACTTPKKDLQIIETFYNAVLGQTEMTDALLKQSLSQPLLESLWEADYDSTYSFWNFRTRYQDGPAEESAIQSIEPMEGGWYLVSYTDMGIPGITEVKMEKGIIADYRPYRIPFERAHGYFLRNDVPDVIPLIITSQEELLQFFGMAAVMGPDGRPTEIDFDKSFVIPVIFPETDRETTIVIDGLFRTGTNELTLNATALTGEQHPTYTIRPVALLVVDRYYSTFNISLQASSSASMSF